MAIIGIDLGTTTSEATVYRNGRPEVLRDRQGNEIVRSVVGIHHKTRELIIGDLAYNQLVNHPELTVEEIKREMGKKVTIPFGDSRLRPEEISTILLKKIKEYAEEFLGESVDSAVITVPANFNDQQRSATTVAGELAGLQVERIVNEPTAAALAFGFDTNYEGKLLVYDLGGGTFDVTILEQSSGILDIKSSSGDNKLGGKDFDRELAEWAASEFESAHGVNLRSDDRAMRHLRQVCEKAKHELSFVEEANILSTAIVVNDGVPLSLDLEVTRETFENLISKYLERTARAIDKALRDAKLDSKDIDDVILVGGSTRIPAVHELVERKLGRKPRTDVDPDRAVALGAAIQASIIRGESDIIIMDVCPLSLGTGVVANINGQLVPDVYDEILPANTPHLTKHTEPYHTLHDNQESVDVGIYQKDSLQDSLWCRDHTLLHSRVIEGLTPLPAGEESLELSYTYNSDGMLDVEVKVSSTGKVESFSVHTNLQSELSAENVESLWQSSKRASEIRAAIHSAEKKLKEIGEHKLLEQKLAELKKALIEGDDPLIDRLDNELTDIVFDLE